MPSQRTTKAKRASASDSVDPTGSAEQRLAIEQAMARQNIRLARSPGAVGPIGRALLLIALLALVSLLAVWVLLAL